MTQQEYKQKKRECWENFKFDRRPLNTDKKIFDFIFDRAYTLGKQEKDAEGEEMLTVSRKKVQEEYAIISEELSYHDAGTKDYTAWHYIKMIFEEFFGSKCLPDRLSEVKRDLSEIKRDLSEPKEDKHFDNILKEGFRGHNRLHIAAQIVAALYANHQAAKGFKSIEEIVHKALDIADTLIKESEKGGK